MSTCVPPDAVPIPGSDSRPADVRHENRLLLHTLSRLTSCRYRPRGRRRVVMAQGQHRQDRGRARGPRQDIASRCSNALFQLPPPLLGDHGSPCLNDMQGEVALSMRRTAAAVSRCCLAWRGRCVAKQMTALKPCLTDMRTKTKAHI